MLFAFSETVSAQTPRMFGARRFLLDDGTNNPTGLVDMSNLAGSLQITTTNGNMSLRSTGTGNIQLGNSVTIGALSAPNTTIDIRGSVSMPIRIAVTGNVNPISATDYIIAYTDNSGVGNVVVTLPAGTQGRTVIIKNLSNGVTGKTLQVTPPTGVQIDNFGAGVAQQISAGGNLSMTFIYDVGTAMWYRAN